MYQLTILKKYTNQCLSVNKGEKYETSETDRHLTLTLSKPTSICRGQGEWVGKVRSFLFKIYCILGRLKFPLTEKSWKILQQQCKELSDLVESKINVSIPVLFKKKVQVLLRIEMQNTIIFVYSFCCLRALTFFPTKNAFCCYHPLT